MKNSKPSRQNKYSYKVRLLSGSLLILPLAITGFLSGFLTGSSVGYILGSCILAYFVYVFVSILLIQLVFSFNPERPRYLLDRKELLEGDRLACTVQGLDSQAVRFTSSLPAMIRKISLSFEATDTRSFKLLTALYSNKTSRSPVLERGFYELISEGFLFRDALNTLSLYISSGNKEPVLIAVRPKAWEGTVKVPEFRGGELHRIGDRRISSDSLTENRKYVPGDDPRRINWKLYGHTEELFSRDNEHEPPPQSHLNLYIDTSSDIELFLNQDRALDYLIRYSATLLDSLRNRGIFADIGMPGSKMVKYQSDNWADILAQASPPNRNDEFPLSDSHEASSLLLLLPHSSGLSSLSSRLLSNKSSLTYAHLVCPPFLPVENNTPLSRLLFKSARKDLPLIRRNFPLLSSAQASAAVCLAKGARRASVIQL